MHRGYLSAHTNKTTSGQILSRCIDQLLYLIRKISEVFTVSPSVNVDYRSDIIVIFNRRRDIARNRGDIGQNLGLSRITPKNWKVAQVIQRVKVILRRFGVDLITDSIARIDPEILSDLFRPGKCAEHALGYRLRGDALDRRQGTIDSHIELRHIIGLLDPEVHRTWNVPDLFHQPARELVVSR